MIGDDLRDLANVPTVQIMKKQVGAFVVVELRKVLLLDGRDGHGHLSLLTSTVATGKRGGEGGGLANGKASDGLVQAFEHVARTDLVGDARNGVDLVALDHGGQVQHHKVGVGCCAVNTLKGAETLTHDLDALVDLVVAHLEGVNLDGDVGEFGQREVGTHVNFSREGELALLLQRNAGDLNLGLAERANPGLGHGVAVEVRQRVVDGVLDHGAETNALVDDARRHLALAEARDRHVLGDVFVGVLDAGSKLVVGDLHAQLYAGGVKVLDGTLHGVLLSRISGTNRTCQTTLASGFSAGRGRTGAHHTCWDRRTNSGAMLSRAAGHDVRSSLASRMRPQEYRGPRKQWRAN